MNKIKIFPTLYKKNKKGTWQLWMCTVKETANDTATIEIVHGQENMQYQTDKDVISSGKNIGKKNETTVWDQALHEAESRFNKKLDSGYSENKVEQTSLLNGFLPMLAQPTSVLESCWNEAAANRKPEDDKAPFAYVQPKLDGVRSFAFFSDGQVQFRSRKNKDLNTAMRDIIALLTPVLSENDHVLLDGEIFSSNEDWTIEDIAGAANKKEYVEGRHSNLTFRVFDCYVLSEPTLNFHDRFKVASEIINQIDSDKLTMVSSLFKFEKATPWDPETEETLFNLLDEAIAKKYEGVMIRFNDTPYQPTHRSRSLVKLKKFLDHEYEVVDIFTPQSGREAGTAIYVCKLPDSDNTFNASSVGSRESRKLIYENKADYIGKLLNVKYQELTPAGVPRFPKGMRIRVED